MSANSFSSGCCETVRCDAACIPGRCFQDVLHGKIVFTFHVFQVGVLVCAGVESRRLSVFGLGLSWRIYDPNEVCVVPAAP